MAYIVPSGTIRICKNVPLNNTYRDTILFDSATEQFSYFLGKAKYTLDDYTYMRVNQAIRVEIKADDLYDCNYIVFRNNSFGTKYFYAFITKITYINNETSEIQYELDVLQTWHFDYQLKQCFVEREHSETDEPGDNLVPENLELGDYIYDKETHTGKDLMSTPYICFFCSFNASTLDKTPRTFYTGKYTFGCDIKYYPYTETDNINTFLKQVAENNLTDGIICAVMLPGSAVTGDGGYAWRNGEPTKLTWTVPSHISGNSLGARVIKNKKLLTYPFNFLYVTNNEGTTANFPYEYFVARDKCSFSVYTPVSANPEAALVPIGYKCAALQENYNEKLTIAGFPQVAYATDAFRAWIAQNSGSTALSVIGGIGQVAGGAALTYFSKGIGAGAGVASMVGGVKQIAGTLVETKKAEVKPPQANGNPSSNLNFIINRKTFDFYHCYIRPEFAEIIDDYFNAYGYACHKVKVPNRSSRPHWNYVKTVNCNAIGSVPVEDMRKICGIYDNGITWWKQGDNIGNYDLDNSPA